MRKTFGLFLLFSIAACGDSTEMTNASAVDTTFVTTNTTKQVAAPIVSNPYSFDTSYEISKGHTPFMVTGYFDPDSTLDTAVLIRHKTTGNVALFIKHGGSDRSFLLNKGKDVGTEFDDFNWVGEFAIVKKGTKVWNNVIDDEIVGEERVPETHKFVLQADGIWVHVDEASGGGIVYFKNNKYAWVQQE